MAEKKPILGLDLNIDDDYLGECVKQTVIAGIAESLNGKNEITSQIVNMVLSQKVDRNGRISGWSSDNTQTVLEYYVSKAIREVAEEEIKRVKDEARPQIAETMRKELGKAKTIDKLVAEFANDMVKSCTNYWHATLGITFEKVED